ncbi:D-tyrosyl-tRNA(Tyr) deacylase [candidate division WOR-3 bacterium]|nr:D-tyrosyl-tRNA(Tyr) deacylase [candidate division WOR-3 bacterium]MCK4576571.1 D-tyrosyl-tRNA(Tyr) deacylase [candidate division WOR-3 bacterium]
MRAVIQRVSSASVSTSGKIIGSIEKGIVILLGIAQGDSEKQSDILSEKCSTLRIFEDENGKLNLSLKDIEGEALVISQFTLYADTSKGRRPSFTEAASYSEAKELYEQFVNALRKENIHTEVGRFGSKMVVSIQNDGPVTIILEV